MTIREIFKKINTYNEVAEMIRDYTGKLIVKASFGFGCSYYCKSFNEFKKVAKREFITEAYDAILERDDYTLGEEKEIEVTLKYGGTIRIPVEFNAYNE